MRVLIAVSLLIAGLAVPTFAQSVAEHLEAMGHLRRAHENMRAEQWDKAEREFQAAIRLEPSLETAHYGLGQVYMATRRYADAVRAYLGCREAFTANNTRRSVDDLAVQRSLDEQIRALEDEKTSLGGGRGNVLATSQFDVDRRIADLRTLQMHSKSSSTVPAWISVALGSAYFRNGAIADAEREYLAALEDDPNVGEAHNNLAVVYLETGRYRAAAAEIKAAERADFRVNPQLKADVEKAFRRER